MISAQLQESKADVQKREHAVDDDVTPLAASCLRGAELVIREWLAYDSLINVRVFDVSYVEWCMQAAILRKRVDDHINAALIALGPRAPSRREIVRALCVECKKQEPYSTMLAENICAKRMSA